jgi:hypothetical protein
MNTTDEALLLFRRLRDTYPKTSRVAKLQYRAYLRWKRRDARVAGSIRPSINVGQAVTK